MLDPCDSHAGQTGGKISWTNSSINEMLQNGLDMVRRPSRRIAVVLDGSNIVHGGAGSKDMNGQRLVNAVALYKGKGYQVFPRMKTGTLRHMKKEKIEGYEALNRMRKEGSKPQLRTYGKDDDLAIIELAISPEVDGWIVTNDTFDKHAKRLDENGKVKPKERQIYAKTYDWNDIDSRLWGIKKTDERGYHSKSYYRPDETWHVEGSQFFHRGLKRAPSIAMMNDPFRKIRGELNTIQGAIDSIDVLREKLDESNSKISEILREEIIHTHPHIRKMLSNLPAPSIPKNKNELGKLLVIELKEICEILDLTKSGTKDVLINRIVESQKKD